MKHPWENFVSTWWPSSLGAHPGFPTVPAEPVGESWRVPWPTAVAPASWMPPTPISPNLPQRGLLSSLDAGRTRGLFGGLTTPLAPLESAWDWGVPPAAPHAGGVPSAADDPYLSPTPRATDWDPVAPLSGGRPAQPLPDASSRPPSSASGRVPERGQLSNSDIEVSGEPEILSDATPYNSWIPGADYADEHHIFPQANYQKMPRETKRVFNKATVGQLFLRLDGRRHWYDEFHRKYNTATGDLLRRFMEENDIAGPEQMTPDHARAVLKAITESEDPRIKYYGEFIRRLRMFYRLRTGRGSE
jgi:hypothetical protein